MRLHALWHSWRDPWYWLRRFAIAPLIAFCIALLSVCLPPNTQTATPTAAPSFDLPSGYTAYSNVTIIVVNISSGGTQGAAAQESIIRQATTQGIDVLVVGCLEVDDVVSVCPTTPFLVHGSASVGGKRVLR